MKNLNKILLLAFTAFILNCCKQKELTSFPVEALNDTFLSIDGNDVTLKNVLDKYPNKDIVIDVWASWCGDCIKGMPKIKELQADYPKKKFVFLSLDRSIESWRKGIQKYKVEGDHYFAKSGWDGAFGKAIDLDWIPSYMIAYSDGTLKYFKATKATDSDFLNALKN